MFQEEEDNVWGPAPLKTQSMDDPWGDSVPQASTSSRPGSPNFGTGSPTSGNILVTEPEELPWVNSNSGMPGAFEDTEDGFATPTETPASPQPRQDGNDKDDDFGDDDFGDFGEENDQDDGFGDFEESEAVAVPAPSHILKSATTRPIDPDSEIDIQTQVMNLLASIIPHPSETPQLTVKPEREQYGTLEQLLITPSSRQLYETLLKAPTEAQALNWKRSKTRQAYFKALDIPLDLEAESSAMAAAQQRRLSEQQHNMASPRASTHNLRTPVPTRPGTPASAIHTGISASRSAPVSRVSSPALPPVLDRSAAQKLINLSPEELQQEPTEKLRQIQTELESLIKVASAQLTHTMDQQEKLTGDADTYDRMIQDLVSTAQKLKPAANNRVSMSSAKQSSDLKRADSLPKKSSSLWSRSRASSPGGQQASQLRQGSMH